MIVLDTHIWVWWVQQDARLTQAHHRWLQTYQSSGLGVSLYSCWEVAKLVEFDRLVLPTPLENWFASALTYPGVRLLEVREGRKPQPTGRINEVMRVLTRYVLAE